jgi:hypothetical protein
LTHPAKTQITVTSTWKGKMYRVFFIHCWNPAWESKLFRKKPDYCGSRCILYGICFSLYISVYVYILHIRIYIYIYIWSPTDVWVFLITFKCNRLKYNGIKMLMSEANLLSGFSGSLFLCHVTSPPASSSSHSRVIWSFSVICWLFRIFTNLYGYSEKEIVCWIKK